MFIVRRTNFVKASINEMILIEMLVARRRAFLVMHSLYNPSFCSDSTNKDISRFFLKLSHLLKFIWYCIGVLPFVLNYFVSITGDFF